MRYLLLESEANPAIVVAILLGGLAIALTIYFYLRKRFGTVKNLNENITKVDVKLNKDYCSELEMKFLENLHRAMPKELIAFPRVGVDQLVSPNKDKNAYNAIMSKYLDVVVFTRKDMTPVLVIDLVQNSSVQSMQFDELDSNVVKVLKAVKLNVIKVELTQTYDLEKLRENVLNALPDKVVSTLKSNYISENVKK